MALEPNPALAQLMQARHKLLMEEAAAAAANVLADNLDQTQGSGIKYPRLPNRSSAPGEFPVRQSGALLRGVKHESGEGTSAQVAIYDDPGKLLGLEFSPPSTNPNQPGTPSRTSGGRAPVWETMTDTQTHAAMKEAMEKTP